MSERVFIFRRHALERMAERAVKRAEVEAVVKAGEVIREYPDDHPLASRLVLGWINDRPLHVVAADDEAANETYIITVYEPDPDVWEPDFRSKKS